MEIKFVKVFSNDVRLDSASLDTLKNCIHVNRVPRTRNEAGKIEGKWVGHMAKLSGKMTTKVINNNTVAGYEPVEEEPFEITIFDGDRFCWLSDTVSSFQHLVVERK